MENKPELIIDPPIGLVFKGDSSVSQLKLKNPNNEIVGYKVKTTAPRHYSVRPNAGLIGANGTEIITVTRMTLNRPEDTGADVGKHKFLVQSTFVPPGELNLADLWKAVPQSEIVQTRFHVIFEDESARNENLMLSTSDNLNNSSYSQLLSEVEGMSQLSSDEQAGENSAGIQDNLVDSRRNYDDTADVFKVNLERENKILKARLSIFENIGQRDQINKLESGMPTLQVVLIAIAAVLVGLILGKIF